ncbi:TPA: glycosyltransferase [bacterium]|nr:glycosyltransferase [bacterium]
MKICDITHFYTTKSGGVKTYLLNKVNYISNYTDGSIDHFLILPSDSSHFEENHKSRFYFIKSPEIPFCKPYRGIISKTKISEVMEKEKPDIVEIGSPYAIPSWVKSIGNEIGYKTIGFYHADIERTWLSVARIGIESKRLRKLARDYIKNTYQDMDLVITPSMYVERYLNNLGILNTQTVYLGLDSGMFNIDKIDLGFRARYNIAKEKTILLYVGRFSKEKRISTLLDIFNKLSMNKPDKYHLILVGGGPEEEKITRIKQDNITILPYCNDKDKLASIYNSSDIFVSASDSETFGLCLLEAQSCGLPVVAFNKTSIPEIIYCKDFLAESEDDFIQKIEIVSNILSNRLRNDIRSFAIENFSWEKTFRNLFSIYYKLYERPIGNNHYKARKRFGHKLSISMGNVSNL